MSAKDFGTKPVIIKAGETESGNFYIIKALEDSSVTVKQSWQNASETETIDLAAQATLEQVTEVTVVSGVVLGFRG